VKKLNAMCQARMIKMLLDGPVTAGDMAEETGLHYVTVLGYMRALRKAGAAHVHGWEPDRRGRDQIAVFKLGPGKNAKRHKLTPAQRQQRVRDKKAAAALLRVTGGAAALEAKGNGRLAVVESVCA
jgi:predicted ArsR family transcriptional regulator